MKRVYPRSSVTNLDRLLEEETRSIESRFGPCDRTVKFLGDHIEVEWTEKLYRALDRATPVITTHANAAKGIQDLKMGKLGHVAQRITQVKKNFDAEGDRLAGRLDELEAKAPATFSKAHTVLDAHHADLDAMDGELRQLANALDGESI